MNLGFFPTSRNSLLTQSNVSTEVGQVRDNHIFIFLITCTSKKELRFLQNHEAT